MAICLIGFMGSGKTTVGKILSSALNRKWIDLDAYIEEKVKQDIPTIFKDKGEDYFRNMERRCLEECIALEADSIISTGGGVIMTPENIKILQENTTIYLEYPFETLYTRIQGDSNRPLVTTYEALHDRYISRLHLYEKASSVTINCINKNINQITEEIISNL